MIKLSKQRIILASGLVVLLLIFSISACNVLGIGNTEVPQDTGPSEFGIMSPVRHTEQGAIAKVLLGSPVQIQSVHQSSISRVELLVQPDGAGDTLLRADIPVEGVAVQQWIPDRPGLFTIKVVGYTGSGPENPYTIRAEVLQSSAISLDVPSESVAQAPAAIPTVAPITQIPQTAPVEQVEASSQADEFSIAVTETEPSIIPVAVATPPIKYPPPPPAPGIPYGPTQAELPLLMPPVGNAAKRVSAFTSDNTRRVLIKEEPDDEAVKVTAGTTIFRAWRVQNVGTNTWGPGYELAFYGGRAMGSGGVAFESTFPSEPARRNIILERQRLIVPEGKPNQTAVVEVMLNAPTVPGIHQSYWRLRNPHGVFFGLIMGVTMEVVRDCNFFGNIYGSPTINRFKILGVDTVFQPTNAFSVTAEFGKNVTLDYDIINADNFDIVIEKPTGDIETISTQNSRDRITFPVNELDQYVVSLYADNGSCTPPPAQVFINVVPPADEQFRAIIIHSSNSASGGNSSGTLRSSSAVQAGDITVEWNHFDRNVDEFVMLAAVFENQEQSVCHEVLGIKLPCYTTNEWVQVGMLNPLTVGGDGGAQGAASISNAERRLCSFVSSDSQAYEIHYQLRAGKNGSPANPEFSNVIVDKSLSCKYLTPFLKDEIEGAFNQ